MSIFTRIFSHKKKNERILLIDVGSARVTGAFVDVTVTGATVTATANNEIGILSNVSPENFRHEMEKALRFTIYAMADLRLDPPDKVLVHLSSPWYASQVRTAKISRDIPLLVTKKVLDDLLTKELKAFEEEVLKERYGTDQALFVLESKTLQVKLNGYSTENPIGLNANKLEMSIFLSVAEENLIDRIKNIISREFNRPVSFASILSASFYVVRDYFPHEKEYLLVDVGGEVTDVSFIKDGMLLQSISFDKGRNFMVRKLSEGLKRSVDESVALCSLYIEGKVEESIKNACDQILTEVKNEWLQAFQRALFSVSSDLSVSGTVLLSCREDVAPWFMEIIRREEFNQYTHTEKEFKVVLLNAGLFHDSLSFKEGTDRNPFIIIEALRAVHYPVKITV